MAAPSGVSERRRFTPAEVGGNLDQRTDKEDDSNDFQQKLTVV